MGDIQATYIVIPPHIFMVKILGGGTVVYKVQEIEEDNMYIVSVENYVKQEGYTRDALVAQRIFSVGMACGFTLFAIIFGEIYTDKFGETAGYSIEHRVLPFLYLALYLVYRWRKNNFYKKLDKGWAEYESSLSEKEALQQRREKNEKSKGLEGLVS